MCETWTPPVSFLGLRWGRVSKTGTVFERLIHQVLAAGACLHLTLWQVPLQACGPSSNYSIPDTSPAWELTGTPSEYPQTRNWLKTLHP